MLHIFFFINCFKNNQSIMALSTLSKAKIESLLRFICEKNGIDPEKEHEQYSRLSNIPLPFDGVKRTGCCALKLNHGLFTQCCDKTTEESDLCKNCERGEARYGKIDDRISNKSFPFVDPRGKKEVRFGNVMEKLGISRQDALEAAKQRGIQIPDECFEIVKSNRGRPKKKITEDVDSSEDEKPKKKRGRPRKEERTVQHDDTNDLVAELIATKKEINTELEDAVQEVGGAEECDKNGMMATIHNHLHGENAKNIPIAWKEVEEKKSEKIINAVDPVKDDVKNEEKVQEKTINTVEPVKDDVKNEEKISDKEAEKASKKAAKEAEKAAKKKAKEVEKAAKKAAKDAEKAKKKAAKEAEKEAKKADKKAAKEAKVQKKNVTHHPSSPQDKNEENKEKNIELIEEPMSPCDSCEEEEVDAITINKEIYLLSKTNVLYDATTQDEVGTYVPGENGEEGTIQRE